jgi:hypothetical protein
MTPDKLQQNILSTYFNLRVGIAVLALGFPLLLWIGGNWQGIGIQDSMSAYYHASANHKSMRDFFVGILFAVGVFLYLYRGNSNLENIALNLAGAFAVGVAIFPMQWGCGDQCSSISLHGVCAISLFLCLAFVCIFCASDTLPKLKNGNLQTRYRRIYLLLGASMILAPVAAFLLTVVFRSLQTYTFIAEAMGIAVFAIYWVVKSSELSLSKAERIEAFRNVKA